jgi:hypothetical protein
LITVPAGPGYTTGLLIERDAQIQGKASVGAAIHADYELYVKEQAVNGKIAGFQTLYLGVATVDIIPRVSNDGQLRFWDNTTFRWALGIDASPQAFAITATEGAFSDATDKFRLREHEVYMYGDSHLHAYFIARADNMTMILSGFADDAQITFRENTTTKYAVGRDHSDDVFKIRAGTSVTGTSAITVHPDNTVTIPSLSAGVKSVYADSSGKLIGVPAPQRELKIVGFKIDKFTASSTSHDMVLIPVGAYVEKIQVWVTVPMNDPSLARLNIGYFADNDHYGVWDIRTATGLITPSPYNLPERFATQRQVALFLEETLGATAGEVYIYIWYSEPSAETLLV